MAATHPDITHERRLAPDRRAHLTPLAPASGGISPVEWIPLALLAIGGLNWASVSLFGVNLVESVFGFDNGITQTIYVLVGLSALYCLYMGARLSGAHERLALVKRR